MMPASAEMGESSQCSHRSLSRTEARHLLCAQGKIKTRRNVCRIAVLKSLVYAFLMCLNLGALHEDLRIYEYEYIVFLEKGKNY
jgi:hypothetical protein